MAVHPVNEQIAGKLREMADVLEQQQADGFRVAAYRRAAKTVEESREAIDEIARGSGLAGLDALPGIGRGIAGAILEMVTTGRWSQLERLLGTLEPEPLFRTLPGIGPDLAARIHDTLHIDTLEALEVAAHDGSLKRVPGIGARRAATIRAVLAERLGKRHIRPGRPAKAPPVDLLLAVDRDYRSRAEAGTLPRIAPKRFNPSGEAWLPILHASRDAWQLTALYSNTKKAHELGRMKDWVVIYFHAEHEPEGQCTVVTEMRGPLAGRRVVRGREGECIDYYARTEPA